MNIFKAIGTVLGAITEATVELCNGLTSAARTTNKAIGMAEATVDQMVAEQQQELADILAKSKAPPTSESTSS